MRTLWKYMFVQTKISADVCLRKISNVNYYLEYNVTTLCDAEVNVGDRIK